MPPRPSLFLSHSGENSFLPSGLDSTLSEHSASQQAGASNGTLGGQRRHQLACFIHSSPPTPPLHLPLPLLTRAPQDKSVDALVPGTQRWGGRGWRAASHCPTGDLSPRTHPHPRLQPGKDGSKVCCSRRGAWRSIQQVGRGRASGRVGRRRQRRPKARPLSQMLTQLRAPGPQGRPGSSGSPHPALGVSREGGPGTVLLLRLSPRSGLKKGTQRDTPGLPGQGGGQPLRGPWVGWVGWVGCRLREGALSKWKPGLGNWPDHSHCTASGETPLLLKGAPPPKKIFF